jgi:hypothetical protein
VPWSWLPLTLERLKGIEPGEVLQALSSDQRWPRPAFDDDTGVWALIIFARTRSGRAIKVAVRPHDGREWQIIAVRDLTAEELAEFTAWEEGRS